MLGFTKSNIFTHQSCIATDAPNLQFSLATLWVYSNIVTPVMVGDSQANLLRIVPVEGVNNNKTIVKIYERPHYVNLASTVIQMIEIMINTTYGLTPIYFKDDMIVKLHFNTSIMDGSNLTHRVSFLYTTVI